MQGWGEMIPTQKKIDYINRLMEVRFDVLDCGSFVNPKTMPQMADSELWWTRLTNRFPTQNSLWLLPNLRGAEKALSHEQVDILGFPFSISETFQHRNTNKSQKKLLRSCENFRIDKI
jgi:hydroxymethylglutaryl-CoA lyase